MAKSVTISGTGSKKRSKSKGNTYMQWIINNPLRIILIISIGLMLGLVVKESGLIVQDNSHATASQLDEDDNQK
jgi:hypothetical protein